MLLPKKDRISVYSKLFQEGVLVARKDVVKKEHDYIENVPNLHVLKLMLSLKSRGYVRETFNWQWYYWYLTEEGLAYLRAYLHLPEEIVPNTHKNPRAKAAPRSGGDHPFEQGKDLGAGRDFKPSFRQDSAGFGRGHGGF